MLVPRRRGSGEQRVAGRETSGSNVIGRGALKVREDLCAPPARELLDARIQTLHVWLSSARISDAHEVSDKLQLVASGATN